MNTLVTLVRDEFSRRPPRGRASRGASRNLEPLGALNSNRPSRDANTASSLDCDPLRLCGMHLVLDGHCVFVGLGAALRFSLSSRAKFGINIPPASDNALLGAEPRLGDHKPITKH